MRIWNLVEGAISYRLGNKFTLDAVNSQCRFVLAFQGFSTVMAK